MVLSKRVSRKKVVFDKKKTDHKIIECAKIDHRQKLVNEQTARDDVWNKSYVSMVRIISSSTSMCATSIWCLSSLLSCFYPINEFGIQKKNSPTECKEKVKASRKQPLYTTNFIRHDAMQKTHLVAICRIINDCYPFL